MRTIIVDDEESAVKVFMHEAAEILELEINGIFKSGREALSYI